MRVPRPPARQRKNEQRPDDDRKRRARQNATRHVNPIKKRNVFAGRTIPKDDVRRIFEIDEHVLGRRVPLAR